MHQLRDYQQHAVDAVVRHFRQTDESAIIVLPTGAGKSLVIAELARLAHYPILVLAHVSELVEQNAQKYRQLGLECSIFAAGLNQKQTNKQVCFASIQSVARNLTKFERFYSLVIIDECHRVGCDPDSQYQLLLMHLHRFNPHLKVLGLTATPYRLNQGWCYQFDYRGFVRPIKEAAFKHCIYELPLAALIRRGYLTPPTLIDAPIAEYSFEACRTMNGLFDNPAINRLLVKSQRVTQSIIEQVIELSQQRQGIMIFAATVEHAQEIIGYLSGQSAAIIVATTSKGERASIIEQFKHRQIKYLVNVSVLTTGFDAPHVDMIALLRPTASVSLFQQIIGRGLRLASGKKDCLVIDYAGNGFDLYQPEIGQPKPDSTSVPVMVPCPVCDFANTFWGKVDANGALIEHYGRRCQGRIETATGPAQCDYRFRFKQCPHCMEENDIAARRCQHCGYQLIDPDDLLKRALSLKDAMVIRCCGMHFSKKKEALVIQYFDEDGAQLQEQFYLAKPASRKKFYALFLKRQWQDPIIPQSVEEAIAHQQNFRHPDFVVARKKQQYWRIQEHIFDYQGRYRLAHQLN
ncbi:DEAD/DEAH box helicase [Celerinatantimonas yamalensis]|uniref:DEAD/DEAH box helicase n=1 Tax=Celerinatantimonas yamalensis TaxID=559956 RepID=A0ABW9G4G6_9GAMM